MGLVNGMVKWINTFPRMGGILKTTSLATISQGSPKPNAKQKIIVFGSHTMALTGTNTKMDTRSVSETALKISNEHGGHCSISLCSGKCAHSHKWKEVPIGEEAINRVE